MALSRLEKSHDPIILRYHLKCCRCKQVKTRPEFSIIRLLKWSSHWCKDCCRVYGRQKYARDKHTKYGTAKKRQGKNSKLLLNFGINLDQFESMLAKQGHCCAICNAKFSEMFKREGGAQVDHDHETGAVRGLLCGCCNRAIGQFKDNIETLRSAAQYLESHKQ